MVNFRKLPETCRCRVTWRVSGGIGVAEKCGREMAPPKRCRSCRTQAWSVSVTRSIEATLLELMVLVPRGVSLFFLGGFWGGGEAVERGERTIQDRHA